MGSKNELDNRFDRFLSKQVRLSPGVRRYISGLKQEGKRELAFNIAKRARKNDFIRKVKTLDEDLALSVANIIESEDPDVRDQFRLIWILVRKQRMTLVEAGFEIRDLLVKEPPNVQDVLSEESVNIRQQVEQLKEDYWLSGL